MQIAYVGNFSQRHCTEVHLAATLESLGHEVIRLQENEIRPEVLSAMIGSDLCKWDLFLFTRTWDSLVTLDHLAQLRERKIPSASYHLDLYVGLKREDGLDNDPFWRTDYVFTPDGDPATQAVMEAKGINHIYMKPGVYEPECYTADPGNNPLGAPVIFVGGGSATDEGPQYGHTEWPYRGKLIKWLQENYAGRFAKFGWPEVTVRNELLNQLFANSKIVIGDSLCLNFTHPYYWSDRVYETLGRGGFIIHPFIEGMQEEFTDRENIVFYKYGDFEGLQKLIDYYLSHDEEREKIRLAGHEFVKNNATYTQRLQRMLDIIFPAEVEASELINGSEWVEIPEQLSKNIVLAENNCWEWQAYKNPAGYGQANIGGKTYLVHRYLFEYLRGELTTDTLDHLCRNRSCVNPDHLQEVTRGENVKRGQNEKIIAWRNGLCTKGHPSEYIYRSATGEAKYCRQCRWEKNNHGALKISLGCGTEPEGADWVNLDIVELSGVNKVHNLMVYPWPFANGCADYIKAKDIIEHMATHLPDGRSSIIAFIEECHRILAPGGTLWIQTPRYDAEFLYIDPTHTRGYHENSFDFFDDNTDFGRATGFYSEAKFDVSCTVSENKNLVFEMVKR